MILWKDWHSQSAMTYGRQILSYDAAVGAKYSCTLPLLSTGDGNALLLAVTPIDAPTEMREASSVCRCCVVDALLFSAVGDGLSKAREGAQCCSVGFDAFVSLAMVLAVVIVVAKWRIKGKAP